MLFYLVKAFIVFHANAEEEEENDKDAHESDADEYDNDVDSQSNGYESAEGQTFAIGNISKQMSSWLSMLAIFTTSQLLSSRKSYSGRICLKNVLIVDQVAIAKTSKQIQKVNLKAVPLWQCVGSRICHLITTAVLKQGMKFLATLTRTMSSCKICSVAKLEGHSSVAVEVLSRWPAASAATSASHKAYISRKASITRRS